MDFPKIYRLANYVGDLDTQVVRYLNSKNLMELLNTTLLPSPNNIELIAKSIIIENLEKITIENMHLYSLMMTVLRNAVDVLIS